MGEGAKAVLKHLAPASGPADLAAMVPLWNRLAAAADDQEVLGRLASLGLWPELAQTWEHLLCAARKVFGRAGTNSGQRNPGYEDLLWRARGFYRAD